LNETLVAFLISLGVSAILAKPILMGLVALKSRQTVSQYVAEHAHKQGTPTMGGLIILAGAVAGLVYWAGFATGAALPVFLLVLGFAAIGFTDDFVLPRVKKGSRGFGWIPKLILQVGNASICVWLLFVSFGSASAWNLAVGVFLVLFFANAYNFADGLDWLAGSILLALGAGIIACAMAFGREMWVIPVIVLLGASLPFMVLNRPPAKVFMGDVGSMAIGGLLGMAVADMTVNAAPRATIPWLAIAGLVVVAVVMLVELVPPPLQILSVKLRKKRLFPMTPIHHAFQKAGWPEIKIVAMFFALQVVGSGIGYLMVSKAVR